MQAKRAIALRYEKQQDAAPRIVAKGAGEVARAIVELADENRVPVLENTALVESLMALEIQSVIPEDLYMVIAEVLAYVYKQKR